MSQNWILFVGLVVFAAGSCGCSTNERTTDPNIRMEQLIKQSQGSGSVTYQRQDPTPDQPGHLTPVRLHGGI